MTAPVFRGQEPPVPGVPNRNGPGQDAGELRERGPGGGVPALELVSVARRFARRWVLRGASLVVRPGEVVALVGRNGAGKTTLLKIAATVLRPTRGQVRVYGNDVAREAARVRELTGLLGHAAALYEDLTAAENLRFAFRMRSRRPDAREIARLLEAVGLSADGNTRVRTFSAGMRRRLALARLLIEPPRLLLMDEPYASLDTDGVTRVNALVRHTRAAGGAVVMATHDLRGLAEVADRMVLLEHGVLREEEGVRRVALGGAAAHAEPTEEEEEAVEP